ncbi:MAG: xylulokinase [Armatimonadetes bacterium]|nr:xylulokinase [Armatimonadota bacterium]
MASLILAHDLGTTGNKATLYDAEGRLVASAFDAYETQHLGQNRVEQDPHDWWRAVVDSTRRLLTEASARDIACVSFSGQMMGCVAVDGRGEALRPAIIWADQRAQAQADLLAERVGPERVYESTGHRLGPSYSIEKIMWVRDQEPEVYARATCFLQAKDYAVMRLTGACATDYSDASGTNAFDLRARGWSDEILEAAGIERALLPEPRPSTAVVGEVLPGPAEACGLRVGTPVVIGGGDGSCAAVGAGSVAEGTAYNYIGSSSWIALATREPFLHPEHRTVTFCHLVPDRYMPAGTTQAAGACYQWFRNMLCQEEMRAAKAEGIDVYDFLNAVAATVPPGCEGLIFLPYLMGERSPHWNPHARGAFIGLTPNHTKAHLCRAVLEGVALNLRLVLDLFRGHGGPDTAARYAAPPNGMRIDAMRVIGGGAKGELWRQIMADAYGVPVLAPAHLEEATSLGAAVAGGVGVGLFRDFSVAEDLAATAVRHTPRASYEALLPVFRLAYEGLVEVFEGLG